MKNASDVAVLDRPEAKTSPVMPSAADVSDMMKRASEDAIPIASLGSGLKIIEDKRVPFDYDLANFFANPDADNKKSLKNFIAERPFSPEHAEKLLLEMKQGTFHFEHVTLMSCQYAGHEYRINGQHTAFAWGLLLLDKDYKHLKPTPMVRCLRYKANSEEDVRQLYATTDKGKPRTRGHTVTSYLFGTPEFHALSKFALKKMAEGFGPWYKGNYHSTGRNSVDEIIFKLKTTHHGLARKVGAFLTETSQRIKHIHRSPVVAAMFATFNVCEKDSIDFWTGVRDGVSLAASDPRLKLRNYLTSHFIVAGRGGMSKDSTVNGEDMYRYCIFCWNAYRNGVSADKIRIPKSEDRPAVK